MPRLRNAAACCKAVNAAMDWLDEQAGDQESWPAPDRPLSVYHKLPSLYFGCGRIENGRRLLIWAKENLMLPGGDFLSAPATEGQRPPAAPVREKAWLGLAAHLTGRYDISLPAARFIATQQGGTSGAVYDFDESGRREESADVRSVACAGLLFQAAGLHENARKAGQFLAQAVELQADQEVFQARMDPGGRAAGTAINPKRRTQQLSYLAGPIIFLCRLHLATGEEEWLDAAMDYFLFSARLGDEALTGEESATLAWAAAALYGITRRRVCYDAAEKITQAWTQKQRADGSWRAGRDEAAGLALTIQNALCLVETLREAQ